MSTRRRLPVLAVVFGLLGLLGPLGLAACGGDGDGADGSDGAKDAAPPGGDAALGDAGPDAPGTTPAIGAQCGSEVCPAAQGCCTGSTSTCREPTSCPTQIFRCDGPEDCMAGVCCFGNQGTGGSACSTSCQDVACHGDGDCGGSTPTCCAKPFTPSYKVCQAQC